MNKQLHTALHRFFGYRQFRRGQQEIIEDACRGNNVLGILPTGTGKSICYQLPAKVMSGTVVVVSPLISLMIDQVKQMKASGFKEVIAFNSFMDFKEKSKALSNIHLYKLIYTSPEMLQQKELAQRLKAVSVSLFVIDEAHCISQWGHEFRPDYLKLASIIKQLNQPPVMALSATATPEVQEDIIKQLKLKEVKKHVYPMDRENIALVVKRVTDNEEKLQLITHRLLSYPGPTMIYFSSREWTEKAAEILKKGLPGLNIAYYHGGMEQADRILIQQQFTTGQLDVICCTSAFGMGINKANIRLVIHFHLPSRVESFIQEFGRAGRDNQQSVSLVLIAPNDDFIPRKLIELELPAVSEIDLLVEKWKEILGKAIFLKENELLNFLNITEIQWRFLQFQLEKNGLYQKSSINKTRQEWEEVKAEIKQVILFRNDYKHRKLSELLIWSQSEGCRRKNLFASFQESVSIPEKACCDRCGFHIEEWNPDSSRQVAAAPSWEKKFSRIMLQEEPPS